MHGVRNVPLDLEFRIVTNGLDPHHLVGLARFLINQILTSLQAGGIIQTVQQIGLDERAVVALFRRQKNDACRPWLVAKELARDGEDEQENQYNHDIVLPGASREVPENKALPRALLSCIGGSVLKHC